MYSQELAEAISLGVRRMPPFEPLHELRLVEARDEWLVVVSCLRWGFHARVRSQASLFRQEYEPTPVLARRVPPWGLEPQVVLHGLRLTGGSWRRSAQNVCLNFSDCDVPVQLHFALFSDSGGYVLKPEGMRIFPDRASSTSVESGGGSVCSDGASQWASFGDKQMPPKVGSEKLLSRIGGVAMGREQLLDEDDTYWPTARDFLSRVTSQLLSLSALPKVWARSAPRPALALHPLVARKCICRRMPRPRFVAGRRTAAPPEWSTRRVPSIPPGAERPCCAAQRA